MLVDKNDTSFVLFVSTMRWSAIVSFPELGNELCEFRDDSFVGWLFVYFVANQMPLWIEKHRGISMRRDMARINLIINMLEISK